MATDSLAEFELLVMLACVHLGAENAYTVTIADHIRDRTGRPVRRANVYTTLQRLERKGFVSSFMGDPCRERGGRPPRLVRVERAGAEAIRNTTTAINAMMGDDLDSALGRVG